MQGWRISMEDADTTVLDLMPTPTAQESEVHKNARLSFFGVYDGHGGEKVATYCGANMHSIITRQESFKKGDYVQGLKDGFLAADRAMLGGMLPPLPLPINALHNH